jgi:hypothetical protein
MYSSQEPARAEPGNREPPPEADKSNSIDASNRVAFVDRKRYVPKGTDISTSDYTTIANRHLRTPQRMLANQNNSGNIQTARAVRTGSSRQLGATREQEPAATHKERYFAAKTINSNQASKGCFSPE